MSENLLRTKLFIPTRRQNLVERPRLFDKLDSGLAPANRLIMVTAPAGFGKTTLVSEWARRTQLPLGWLTLDEGDNEATGFLRYLVAALQGVDERIGKSIEPALHGFQPPVASILLTEVLNDLLVLDGPALVVLDDYHLISNAEVHAGVNFLVDHLPPAVHLVIATRADPPLRLARRRGQGSLCELRAADLRFSRQEVAIFINQVMELNLTADDIAALESRTEGWAASLQMAAISLQDVGDRHAFVVAFSGDNRYISDYLLEEVLQRQPVEFQRFLLQTSILDRFCAELCNAVTGRSDSQSILNLLERNNLFIIPLDDQRVWFRYHKLFAGLLRKRLEQVEGEEGLGAYQRRAIEWYAAQRDWLHAIDYAFACNETRLSVELIQQGSQELYLSGELNAMVRWAELLPEAYLKGNNRLVLGFGWAAHATGRPELCRRLVHLVEENVGMRVDKYVALGEGKSAIDELTRSALVEATVMSARLTVDNLEVSRALHLAEAVLPDLDPRNDTLPFVNSPTYSLRNPNLYILGLVYKLRGELTRAENYLRSAFEEAQEQKNIFIVALALGQLGDVQALQGKFGPAQETYRLGLEIAAQPGTPAMAFFAISRVGLGEIAYEQNHLEQAEAYLTKGVSQGRLWNSWESLLPGYSGLARLYQARNDLASAHKSLDRLLEETRDNRAIVEPSVETWRAWLRLRAGELAPVQTWAEQVDLGEPGENFLQWELQALMVARLRLAQDRPDESLSILKRLQSEAQAAGRWRRMLDIHLLACQAHARLGQEKEALEALRQALALAGPEVLLRPFLDEGQPLQEVLTRLYPQIADGEPKRFAARLIQEFSGVYQPDGVVGGMPPDALVEALSEREFEVLQFMARGLTNAEIARRLYLSPNTLKAHTQNIYQKLDVHSRMQAVNRGRELGLLED